MGDESIYRCAILLELYPWLLESWLGLSLVPDETSRVPRLAALSGLGQNLIHRMRITQDALGTRAGALIGRAAEPMCSGPDRGVKLSLITGQRTLWAVCGACSLLRSG